MQYRKLIMVILVHALWIAVAPASAQPAQPSEAKPKVGYGVGLIKPVAPPPALKSAVAGTYVMDKRHSSLIFRMMHMELAKFTIRFNGIDSAFNYDPANPANMKLKVTIDPKSIDTGDPKFNEELQGPRYLDSAKYPVITFESHKIPPGLSGRVPGVLNLKGISKPVVLNVKFNRTSKNIRGIPTMGFSATGTVNWKEHGISVVWLGPAELQIETEHLMCDPLGNPMPKLENGEPDPVHDYSKQCVALGFPPVRP